MNVTELTNEKILEETAKLQYLFGLKKVIRYDQNRHATDSTESVAEHVYGMHILAQYFLALENPARDWDTSAIYEMITLHDIDEIETGDVLGYTKTAEVRALELAAMRRTIKHAPAHMQAQMDLRVTQYETQTSREAQFVKAIDKIEPLFQIFNEEGRVVLKQNKTTAEQSLRIKTPYIESFPAIKRFAEVIHQALIDGDYYWEEGK